MSKNILVVYHNHCDDGMGAALAAFLKFGEEAEYLGASYNDPIPNMEGKEVYIFDFSYPREILLNPNLKAKSIVMLDHHNTALKTWNTPLYVDTTLNILVRFDMSRSGAMLAWDYLFPDQKAPILFEHVQDYDLWKFDLANTRYFAGNLRSYPQTIPKWKEILELTNDPIGYSNFVNEGIAQDRFFRSQISYLFKRSDPLTVCVSGEKGLGINASSTFADYMGSELAGRSGTFGMIFSLEGDLVTCSLRSIKDGACDVSELCRSYGGGGHKSAAGMKVSIETFLKEILCTQRSQGSSDNLPSQLRN